jgi:hypothetical protein
MKKSLRYLPFAVAILLMATLFLTTQCDENDNAPNPPTEEQEEIIYLDQAIREIKLDKIKKYCGQLCDGETSDVDSCCKYVQYLSEDAPTVITPEFATANNFTCCKCPDDQGECSCSDAFFIYSNETKFAPVIKLNGRLLNYRKEAFNRGGFVSKKVILSGLPAAPTNVMVEVDGETLEATIENGKVKHVEVR